MEPLLSMRNITKQFPGVLALDQVNFTLNKGEIHALVGENGAGKSTLMKILGGVYTPDGGSIEIGGKPVEIASPADSIANKIGVIYQEFNLVHTLDVASNIFLGKEISKGGVHLDRREMTRRSGEIMAALGVENFDCRRKVKHLSVAMQQLVEIGKAIFNAIDILVMDEPTAVLTEKETESLFRVIRQLREKGLSIIYISHRLEEIIPLCDRISVLRDGKNVETLDNSGRDVSKRLIVNRMVGRELGEYYPPKEQPVGEEEVLRVEGLTHKGLFQDVSFSVRRGETLGFSGLVGAGRSEIMKAIFGALPLDAGRVYMAGQQVRILSPRDALRNGIALVPEDRKQEGVVLGMSLSDNICLASHPKLTRMGRFVRSRKMKLVNESVRSLQIRPADPARKIAYFSGGNQQKGVLAKWMATNPSLIIMDEPTRGIDVGAKIEIYHLINRLTAQGVGVILVSSELLELLGVCDRILVVREGSITAEFDREAFSQDAIMNAAIH